jgi:putative FmdB family regulatory protein
MPMYDYHCQVCSAKFEESVYSYRVLDAEIKCPKCKKKNQNEDCVLPHYQQMEKIQNN